MMAGDEIRRCTDFPHRGQVVRGSSFMLCLISNLSVQLSH
jgi:hypothetical protein